MDQSTSRIRSLLLRRFKALVAYNNALMNLRAARDMHEGEDVVRELEAEVRKQRVIASEFANTQDQDFIDNNEYVPL